ncbi:unnamed protein product [Musa acuminata subsp. malaccensis]|uniref:(wild Malaysian banana) hypothetical protein n=1 Tax=Musa acuminata subsp. malaccensis TaxID=214687 RepID=A0A8D7AI82_MUSAM|nr:unnamed protein product [Musa acuminata subsp. malaccensis]
MAVPVSLLRDFVEEKKKENNYIRKIKIRRKKCSSYSVLLRDQPKQQL